MLYISTKFCEIISNGIKVIERTLISIRNIKMGNNHTINVGGVIVVNLCTSSVMLYILPSFVKLS